jgi:Uncharacterized protein conserved in bacteria (DUF2332)
MRAVGEQLTDVAGRYRWFAEVEAVPVSPRYAELADAVAADADVLAFLATLPTPKQQPNLLFGALRYLHAGAVAEDAAQLRAWVLGDADRLRATMLARVTQTNEAARCAALLPLLVSIPGPLALVEVGSSAGLCLHPDRYAYRYDGVPVGGPSAVELSCTTTGTGPRPGRLPEVVHRGGVDLDPLDPADPGTVAWLRALIWPGPESAQREERLVAAAAIAAAEPVHVRRGDLLEELPAAVAAVPPGCTTVVLSTAVLAYLPEPATAAFTELVTSLPVRWISQEGVGVLPSVRDRLPAPPAEGESRFVLALDGEPLAFTRPHGGRIDWLPAATALT